MSYKFNPFTGQLDDSLSAADKQKINLSVVSNIAGIAGADAVTNIVSLTQAEYDAIASPSASTLYVITS